MYRWLVIIFISVSLCLRGENDPGTPLNIRVLKYNSPIGIDTSEPMFSWLVNDPDRGDWQYAFEIIVSDNEVDIDNNKGTTWNSGIQRSKETKFHYKGKPLKSTTKYWWKVRTWDRSQRVSSWSDKSYFVTGFLNKSDWNPSAKWISAPVSKPGLAGAKWIWDSDTNPSDRIDYQSAIDIPADRKVVSAKMSITGDSCYSCYINDSAVVVDHCDWKEVCTVDIKPFLKQNNQLKIQATKPSSRRKKGGIIARAEIHLDNNDLLVWVTDSVNGYIINSQKERQTVVLGNLGREPWLLPLSKKLTINDRSPMFRKSFVVKKRVREAYLFISGLGVYKAYLNGHSVGEQLIPPAWTDYDKTVNYVTYEVSSLLEKGENVIGVMLGQGWFDYQTQSLVGRHGLGESAPHIRNYGIMRLKSQLTIKYEDGSSEDIVSDPSWKTDNSPYTLTHVFGSEDYDARLEQPGWNKKSFNDRLWSAIQLIEAPKGKLVAQRVPPVVNQGVFPFRNKYSPDSDIVVFDVGHNINGQYEITVSGPKGASIQIIPGETLEQGRVKPIAHKYSTYSTYTLKGQKQETWRLTFSTTSFRYIEIRGVTQHKGDRSKPYVHDVRGYWVYSDAPRAGYFKTSDKRYNQIYQMVENTLKNNLVSIHTDCPSYEKLGWLEVLANTATSYSYLFDMQSFWEGCSQNMRDGQRENGLIPNIIPDYTHGVRDFDDSPSWGTAAFVVPWLQYLIYKDSLLLAQNYQSLKKYLDYLESREDSKGLLTHGLGDWMATAGEQKMNVENASYARNLCIMEKIATLLQEDSDQQKYRRKLIDLKTRYNAQFFDSEQKCYLPKVQVNQVLPLAFGLVPEGIERSVVENLKSIIKNPDTSSITEKRFGKVLPYHTTVGDVGSTYLWQVLGDYGLSSWVEKMILQASFPSYFNFILSGMTTMPEHWVVEKARSFNHDMYAGIMEWFYRSVGGIRNLSPGYDVFSLNPAFELAPQWVECSYLSSHGKIESSWEKRREKISWKVQIPIQTSALIYFPIVCKGNIRERGCFLEQRKEIEYVRQEKNYCIYRVESGSYKFSFPYDERNIKSVF